MCIRVTRMRKVLLFATMSHVDGLEHVDWSERLELI
jgi:hypothetical protein